MQAWPEPDVPVLPGRGDAIRVFDTSTGSVRTSALGADPRLYVCGITPYDATHIGHANTYVAFDLLVRAWRDAGLRVSYAQNVTDVDDPLLERAAATGQDWRALAERETDLFREDMTALRVLPPQHYVGAVEAIETITAFIDELRARGATYHVDGDLYFPVSADPHFGEVAHLSTAQMLDLAGERGGDPARPGKKDALDALLWRAARAGEPSWPSPFGPGRPGWHIECTAIALDRLGNHIDVQGGGNDLGFPHHEFGASHAHVGTGAEPFAHNYVHAGMVGYRGEKMSKSKGNLVFAAHLRRDGAEPAAIRMALLAHHYRSDWEWSADKLAAARARLHRWRAAVARPDGPDATATLAEVRRAIADDLDAPGALAAVDAWSMEQERAGGTDPAAPGVVSRLVDALLGVAL